MLDNATQDLASLNLPPMDQVGLVYKDLNAAIAMYEPFVGKFEVFEYGEMDYDYRGQNDTSEIILAIAKTGDVEIELIQWVSGGTPHKEFLDEGKEGLHHIRFPVDDLNAKMAEAAALGYEAVWHKVFAEGLAVAYLKHPNNPVYIELFENHHQ